MEGKTLESSSRDSRKGNLVNTRDISKRITGTRSAITRKRILSPGAMFKSYMSDTDVIAYRQSGLINEDLGATSKYTSDSLHKIESFFNDDMKTTGSIYNGYMNVPKNVGRESKTEKMVNSLPLITMINRKNRDRCLSCLCNSIDKRGMTSKLGVACLNLPKTPTVGRHDEFDAIDSISDSDSISLPPIEKFEKTPLFMEERKPLLYLEEESRHFEEIDDVTNDSNQTSNNIVPESTISSQSNLEYLTNIDIRRVSEKSSGNSSDSEEANAPEEKLAVTTLVAFCNAQTIWTPSLEPLMALKNKKPTSMKTSLTKMHAEIDDEKDEEQKSGEYSDEVDEDFCTPRDVVQEGLNDISTEVDKSGLVRPKGVAFEMNHESAKSGRTLIRTKTVPNLISASISNECKDKNKDADKSAVFKRSNTSSNLKQQLLEYTLEETENDEDVASEEETASQLIEKQNSLSSFLVVLEEKLKSITDDENVKDILEQCDHSGCFLAELCLTYLNCIFKEHINPGSILGQTDCLETAIKTLKFLIDSSCYWNDCESTSSAESCTKHNSNDSQ